MRAGGVAVALVALTACAGAHKIEEGRQEPPVPVTAEEFNSPATTTTVAATTTTTTEGVTSTTAAPAPATTVYLRVQTTTGDCGGTLPPCYVMMRESSGSLTVYNASGSGASGKWQFMPSTWNNYGGYANAADAPRECSGRESAGSVG